MLLVLKEHLNTAPICLQASRGTSYYSRPASVHLKGRGNVSAMTSVYLWELSLGLHSTDTHVRVKT